jgi:hypothetical protein
MDDVHLIAFIGESGGHQANKNTFNDRGTDPNATFQRAAGSPAACLGKIIAGDEIHPSNAKEAGEIARALQGIGEELPVPIERLRAIAGECLDAIAGAAAAAPGSYIRPGNRPPGRADR